jgi:N-ethylmaleimide reductase
MSEADIQQAIGEYAQAAKNAIEAGFDGVELHGANGYLIDQFLNPAANQRTDGWGGAPEGLVRFAVEVAKAAVAAIGSERVGIRVSPYGAFNDVAPHDATHATQALLAQQLGALKLAYIHVVDHSGMGAPEVKPETKAAIRANFGGPYIMSGGYDRARAESDLAADKGELVAFGVPFLANPDLVARLEQNAALNTPDQATFYLPGPAGYTDYPTL